MKGQTNTFTKSVATNLRKEMTEAERALWQRLRGEEFGVKFRRQHPFESYVLDFVCVERKLVIEVDGAQHAEQLDEDRHRTERLEAAGFRVLRFWNNEVLNEMDGVLAVILAALKSSI